MEIGMIHSGTDRKLFSALIGPDPGDSFGETPVFRIGLTHEGSACGILSGIMQDRDVFRMISLYVTPDCRRRGGGSALFKGLMTVLAQSGASLIVASVIENGRETEALEGFLLHSGFQHRKAGGRRFRCKTEAFCKTISEMSDQMGALPEAAQKKRQIQTLSCLKPEERKRILKIWEEAGEERAFRMAEPVCILDDFCVYCLNGKYLKGFLAAGLTERDELIISDVRTSSHDPVTTLKMLRAFVDAVQSSPTDYDTLYLDGLSSGMDHLIERIPGAYNIQKNYEYVIRI